MSKLDSDGRQLSGQLEARRGRTRDLAIPMSPEVSRRMSAQRVRDTQIELAIRRLLHGRGLRYRVHQRPLPALRRVADLIFAAPRVAVFIDGCFWHGCPQHASWPKTNADFWRGKIESNRQRDEQTNDLLRQAGWISCRVWEHEDPVDAADRIAAVVTACPKR